MTTRFALRAGLGLLTALAWAGASPMRAQPRILDSPVAERLAALPDLLPSAHGRLSGSDLLDRVVESAWNGAAWAPGTETRHTYVGGQRTSIETRVWVESTASWVPDLRETFTYGPAGMIEAVYETWDPGPGAYWSTNRTRYTYSSGPGGTFLLTEELEETWDGIAWVPDLHTQFTYSGGWAAEILIRDWNGSAWVNLEREVYEEAGGMLSQVFYEWSGTEWTPHLRTIYPGMGFADLVAWSERLAAEAEQMVTSMRLFLLFPPTVNYEWTGTAWREVDRTRIETDTQGRTVHFYMDGHDGSAWAFANRYSYRYGPSGLLESTRLEMHNAGDGSWMLFSQEEYAYYDGSGLLRSATDYMINFMNPTELLPDRLQEFWWTTGTTVAESDPVLPAGFVLRAAYPNPFNPSVLVPFDLASRARVVLEVIDGTGRRVATLVDEPLSAGRHEVRFDADGLPSGVYLVVFVVDGVRSSRPVALVR